MNVGGSDLPGIRFAAAAASDFLRDWLAFAPKVMSERRKGERTEQARNNSASHGVSGVFMERPA
jgi:hypothetical protein